MSPGSRTKLQLAVRAGGAGPDPDELHPVMAAARLQCTGTRP